LNLWCAFFSRAGATPQEFYVRTLEKRVFAASDKGFLDAATYSQAHRRRNFLLNFSHAAQIVRAPPRQMKSSFTNRLFNPSGLDDSGSTRNAVPQPC
jgi:hypothetical protein